MKTIFTGASLATHDIKGYDTKKTIWTNYGITPNENLLLRRRLYGLDPQFGEIRDDLILFDPNSGNTRSILSESVYVPENIRKALGSDVKDFGSLDHVQRMDDNTLVSIQTTLPDNIARWPTIENFNSWKLAPQVPMRAALVYYDLKTKTKTKIDLTDIVNSNLKDNGGDYDIHGHLLLSNSQQTALKEFLTSYMTASRSMLDENPLRRREEEAIRKLSPIAIRKAHDLRYDTKTNTVQVYIANGSCHESQELKIIFSPDDTEGYKTKLETTDPGKYFEREKENDEKISLVKKESKHAFVFAQVPGAKLLSPKELGIFASAEVPIIELNAYPEEESYDSIMKLIEAGVSAEDFKRYKSALPLQAWQVENLAKAGVSPDEVAMYEGTEISSSKIQEMHEEGIPPELGSKLARHFKGKLFSLHFKKEREENPYYIQRKDLEKCLEYDPRFDGYDLAYLLRANISPKDAATYPAPVRGNYIPELIKEGVSPELAKEFHGIANLAVPIAKINYLHEKGVPGRVADFFYSWGDGGRSKLESRLKVHADSPEGRDIFAEAIVKISDAGVVLENFAKYDDALSLETICFSAKKSLTVEEVNKYVSVIKRPSYHSRVTNPLEEKDLVVLIERNISADLAFDYLRIHRPTGDTIRSAGSYEAIKLTADDIARLHEARVKPENLARLHALFPLEDVLRLGKEDVFNTLEHRTGYQGMCSIIGKFNCARGDIGKKDTPYHSAFTGEEIASLVRERIFIGQNDKGIERFGKENILEIAKRKKELLSLNGDHPVLEYPENISVPEIISYSERGISLAQVKSYKKYGISSPNLIQFIGNITARLKGSY